MTSVPTPLERAFSLARTGKCAGVSDIRAQLKAEGFAVVQLEGPSFVETAPGLVHDGQGPLTAFASVWGIARFSWRLLWMPKHR